MFTELNIVFSQINNLKTPDINCPDMGQAEIELWFDQIRLTDQVQSLKTIFEFLKKANSYQVTLNQRIFLLEKLHTPVLSLVGNLKPHFLNTQMPLSAENNQQVDLCLSVYKQFIQAYAIILHEQLINKKKSWSFLKSLDAQIAFTIQRLIRYLSQIVLTEFEVYRQSEKEIWDQLYTLFSFSEKKNFSNIAIIDPFIEEKTSIKVTFLQVLLLALSDPYHFNQQQIYYIYKHLANWAKLVDLVAHKSIKQDLYTAINLTDNYMPTFYPRGHQPDHQKALFIDSHKLSLQILNDDSDFNNGFLSPKIKACLLQKLKTSWSVYIDRNFDRNDYYSELKVVIGLNHVHYVLNNYQQPNWIKKAEYTSKVSALDEVDYEQMMNSMPFQNKKPDEIDYDQMLASVTYESTDNNTCNSGEVIENFLTENESLNGLSLIWVKDYPLNIKIGEVVALSHEKNQQPDSWFIGVIRRVQHFNNEPLKVGVQLLSPTGTEPVEIRKKNKFKYFRALYLPEFKLSNKLKESNEVATLLVDALTFEAGMMVDIKHSHEKRQREFQLGTKLIEEIETTPFYMRFKFEH
ncbi:MAG: hypothetical protein QM479_15855 [Pseudomonadota bacterium]